MSRIAEFRLPDGQVVLIEADDETYAGEERASIQRLFAEEGGEPADLAGRLKPVVDALRTVYEKTAAAMTPDEIELQAGIKFVGQAGVIISRWGSEASISIKLKWNVARR